jgi:hypothetical protein
MRPLSWVVGWEAFIVLCDIRGLNEEQARRVSLSAALALIDAAVAAAVNGSPAGRPDSPRQ